MRVLPPRTYTADPHIEAVLPYGVQHPAKMSPGLCRDLFLRYTLEGQTVLDPFGGRGTSLIGITLGRNVILRELEPPFVEHITANYEHLKAHTLPGIPLGEATIQQGDSRHIPLPTATDAVLSSPPYEGVCSDWNLTSKKLQGESVAYADERHQPRRNIGNLRHDSEAVDAAVTSPPFGAMNAADAGGNVVQRPAADRNGWDGGREAFVYSETTPGQIGNMPHERAGENGRDSAVLSSPPFGGSEAVDGRKHNNATNLGHGGGNGARQNYEQPGNIAHLEHAPDAVVSSPPYGDLADRNRSEEGYSQKMDPVLREKYGSGDVNRHIDGYGTSPGQIGRLAHVPGNSLQSAYGQEEAASGRGNRGGVRGGAINRTNSGSIRGSADSSEEHSAAATGATPDAKRSGETPRGAGHAAPTADRRGELELEGRPGQPDLSPSGRTGSVRPVWGGGEPRDTSPGLRPLQQRAGEPSGALCELPHDGSQAGVLGGEARRSGVQEQRSDRLDAQDVGDGYGETPGQIGGLPHAAITSPPYANAQLACHDDATTRGETADGRRRAGTLVYEKFGTDAEQISNQDGETYATACLAVYRECYRVVRPGGVLVLVTGDYVRQGQVIDLAEDTIKLAVAAGWTPVERWRHEKAQVSFWRRLHHKQGRPVVTHEDVLVFAKGTPAWEFAELTPTIKAPAALLHEGAASLGVTLPLPLEGVA